MNAERDDATAGFEGLERRARAAFDASVDAIDDDSRTRLRQARQRAIEAATRRKAGVRAWVPAGALAAAVVAVTLVLRLSPEGPAAPTVVATPVSHEPLEMLAADEDFTMVTSEEDLEFYAWVELATVEAVAGQTG